MVIHLVILLGGSSQDLYKVISAVFFVPMTKD